MEVENNEEIKEKKKVKKSRSRTITGYVLFLLFGIGTWLNLNGIWIELPLLIPRLSEGWSLSPQLGMASNIANIGPLIIALIRHIIGESSSYEVPSITIIFLVGISVPLVLSFTWFKQTSFTGKSRSIHLLILSFFLALVNCTSSVTYLPFVNRFHPKWLNIYFAGESLSSLIPAMLGLMQGVGQEPECIFESENSTAMTTKHYPPRFSVEVYLICLSVVMLISFISFLLLWRTHKRETKRVEREFDLTGEHVHSTLLAVKVKDELKEEHVIGTLLEMKAEDELKVQIEEKKEKKFSRETIIYLLIILWTSILLIGCIPSINSYSLNPYGASTFHYVLVLCQCCYPFVSLIATVRPQLFEVSTLGITISTISGTLAFCYIFLTAFLSPCSPFVDQRIGKYIITLMWIFVYLVFYYERIALGNYFNKTSGHRGLFWYGLLTQGGAFIGALFIFTLTSFDVFKERDLCTAYHCH